MHTLEKNARRAKEANSFNDYKAGSASAEYQGYCQEAEKAAAWAIKRLTASGAPDDRIKRVNALLEKYKEKKLAWLNAVYLNRASVPSVLIAGPSNFPVRKKEQQNARERALYQKDSEYIIDQIKSIGRDAGTIRSDDKNAVERIKAKIKNLEAAPPDSWGYNKTEIRRLRERLLVLAPEEFSKEQENITVNGVKTYDEIVALWDDGKVSRSAYDPENGRFYYDLALDFYNGKRHYREFLNIEVDETGENMRRYDIQSKEMKNIPLTTETKYALIVGKIAGSGNKAIMYQHLKSLMPSVQAAQKEQEAREESGENETVTISGEAAEVIRNREAMRLQLIFNGKPGEAARNKLKSNGFRWAPSTGAWQRLLNNNAEHALKRITE